MKACYKCREEKALSEFYRQARRKDGHDPRCKSCATERLREWRELNREKMNRQMRAYRNTNQEKVTEYHRKRREVSREMINAKARSSNLESRTGAIFHGLKYSAAEDLIILRDDLTVIERSAILGRTRASVNNRRQNLRKNGITVADYKVGAA